MQFDIQAGPIIMWACWLTSSALALACVAYGGCKLSKSKTITQATGWLLWIAWMGFWVLDWGNRAAYWFGVAWLVG